MRIDLLLVEKKLVASRTQAQDLILAGFVFIKKNNINVQVLKSNLQVSDLEKDTVYIQKNDIQKYVSRGGLKLEHALLKVKLSVDGMIVLDIGQSTGGFTDCLLQHQIKSVVGIDVGHGQIHESLKLNNKVTVLEGLHVKDLSSNEEFKKLVPKLGFDLLVIDVSFVSLTKVIPFVKEYLKLNGYYLFLVKPQFELSAKDLDHNGIVKKIKSHSLVQKRIQEEARLQLGDIIDYFQAEITGKDGNQEHFIYGRKTI
ncbi:MAG: TlyA family RNA methyltransferase [Pseudobdellovibrio sp.]